MNKYKFILIFISAFTTLLYPQNKISFDIGYGNYLVNSENSLKIANEKDFKSYMPFSFSYERKNIFGIDLMFQYSYNRIINDDAIIFARTGPDSPEIISTFSADISLVNHNFDFAYIMDINNLLSFGFGTSFVITNRIVKIDLPSTESESIKASLYDKLASSGLGLNGLLNFHYPLYEGLFITSEFKLRYTHSIWFDKGIRNLDNYKQEFLTAQISAGVGYEF